MADNEQHWTAASADAFAHKVALDFIAQIENRVETLSLKHVELANRLGLTEGAVSKALNNPQNLTLKTIAKYSRALGLKAAIVAYDDDDPENHNGLIASDIFTRCWEFAGKPRDVWSLDTFKSTHAATNTVLHFHCFIWINDRNTYVRALPHGFLTEATQVYGTNGQLLVQGCVAGGRT